MFLEQLQEHFSGTILNSGLIDIRLFFLTPKQCDLRIIPQQRGYLTLLR